MWIDTHCHLDAAEFDTDRDAVRAAARQAGVTRCVIPAVHAKHWAEVAQLQSASAHADAGQLMQWLRAIPGQPLRAFVVHGDLEASDCLRRRIENELHWHAMAPEHGSTWAV